MGVALSSRHTPPDVVPKLLAFLLGVLPLSDAPLVVGAFSREAPGTEVPAGWEPLRLGHARPTQYRVVRDAGTHVVRADADGSASGLIRRVEADPATYPVLRWRWKVENVHPRGDYRRRSGDDYAARVYVTFAYDPARLPLPERVRYRALRALGFRDVPVRALNYVWANRADAVEARPNAFTDWVRMVPVERGSAHLGVWREARRNLVEDYRAAFGEDPPPISGIAVMTDGDNTGGRATAFYGDIVLERR